MQGHFSDFVYLDKGMGETGAAFVDNCLSRINPVFAG